MLENDRAFAAYVLLLTVMVVSVITASVVAGVAAFPRPMVFLEHLALGLLVRASYKSLGGFDWSDWSIWSEPAGEEVAAMGSVSPPPRTWRRSN